MARTRMQRTLLAIVLAVAAGAIVVWMIIAAPRIRAIIPKPAVNTPPTPAEIQAAQNLYLINESPTTRGASFYVLTHLLARDVVSGSRYTRAQILQLLGRADLQSMDDHKDLLFSFIESTSGQRWGVIIRFQNDIVQQVGFNEWRVFANRIGQVFEVPPAPVP